MSSTQHLLQDIANETRNLIETLNNMKRDLMGKIDELEIRSILTDVLQGSEKETSYFKCNSFVDKQVDWLDVLGLTAL